MNKLHWLVVTVVFCHTSSVFAQRPGGPAKPKPKPNAPAAAPAKPPQSKLPAPVREPLTVQMEVAPVNASGRSETAVSAGEIDFLVEAKLRDLGLQPNPIASDEVFLRRVYLDVTGRIPSLEETKSFLDSTEPQKREDLIDELLSSPDYVSNFYNFWADTLRLVQYPQGNIVGEPYMAYVKDQIRQNRPYDQWVYEMLTADGKLWDNPATGFQMRDEGMPLPYVDNTVRVFLGTQIGCAQCHDHPFDSWSQYQFYQLAAFTAGTRTRLKPPADPATAKAKGNPANRLIEEARAVAPGGNVSGEYQRVVRANSYEIYEVPAALRLPHDYAYADAKPKDIVKPQVLWGDVPETAKGGTPREQFAAWVTAHKNERFKRTIANRMWKRMLGIGLIEPIDDFRDDSDCANEKLLRFLSDNVARINFDLKEFVRTILYSKTYQRESSDYQLTSGEMYYFPGPVLRRMTAEQVWDSILTLAVNNPWAFQRPTAEDFKEAIDLDLYSATMADAERVAQKFASSYHQPAYRKLLNQFSYQGNILCRSSELPSPLPAEHFLRQFGQGDRETINGQDDSATVPQILAMFNGPITHVMLESGSVIYDNVMNAANPRDAVDTIFLSTLTRMPDNEDRREALREVQRAERPAVGLGNVIWALLNTREFLFVQ
jgi:hypothetical protein